jgi:hypothetical protein
MLQMVDADVWPKKESVLAKYSQLCHPLKFSLSAGFHCLVKAENVYSLQA